MERLSTPEHWNMIYGKYKRHELGWYAPLLQTSLEWIQKHTPQPSPTIIEIGGGSSTLVDALIEQGHLDITLVDISEKAIEETQQRLGNTGDAVRFICSDVRSSTLELPQAHVWHDRAAFHFLRNQIDIDGYKSLLINTLEENGAFILGVFSVNAPDRCSGLLVHKWTLDDLKTEFQGPFDLIESKVEMHVTPGSVEQEYLYTAWRRTNQS